MISIYSYLGFCDDPIYISTSGQQRNIVIVLNGPPQLLLRKSSGPWICGKDLTMADIAWFVTFIARRAISDIHLLPGMFLFYASSLLAVLTSGKTSLMCIKIR